MSTLLTDKQIEQAAAMYALGSLHGIGLKSILEIARAFPQLPYIAELSQGELANKLSDQRLVKNLSLGLATQWKELLLQARHAVEQHLDKGIVPLPITSHEYPLLLKLIKDPPPLLYVKGDKTLLNQATTLAIIGTREATPRGLSTARTIAYEAARRGCVIVSGLAKGTDTAAHLGAIEAGGKTIAVLATPLDKVYPAENKKLADTISTEAGILVSECAIGTGTNKGTFVARDRIQSGLSLGVFPIQTDVNGGTMHTVRFAREQQRPLFCSPPPKEEMEHEKYRGILYLIEQIEKEKHIDKKKRTVNLFPLNHPGIYERLVERLEEQRQMLLAGQALLIPSPHTQMSIQSLPTLPAEAPLAQPSNEAVVAAPSLTKRENQDARRIDSASTIVTPTPAIMPTTVVDIPHRANTIAMPVPSERTRGSESASTALTGSAIQTSDGISASVPQEIVQIEQAEAEQEMANTAEPQQEEPTETASQSIKRPKKPRGNAAHNRKHTRQEQEAQKNEHTDLPDTQNEQNNTVHPVSKEIPIAKSAQPKRRSSGDKSKNSQPSQRRKSAPEAEQAEIAGFGLSQTD